MTAPPIEFSRKIQTKQSGIRVVWELVRDSVYHPQSFEVVASGDGVHLCGHSPCFTNDDVAELADILGQAAEVVDMIRDGFTAAIIETVLDTYMQERDAELCKS
jgi:hypothetical protein